MKDRPDDRPGVLHVMHGNGGGIEVAVRNLAWRTVDEYRHVLLWASGKGWILETPGDDPVVLRVRWGNPFRRISRWLRLDLCHVHHLTEQRSRIHAWLLRSRLPLGITLHDFHFVCPRVHMVPPGSTFCNAPTETAVCERCLAADPVWRGSLAEWRRESRSLLAAASFVTAPTRFTRDVIARYAPDMRCFIVPHRYAPDWPALDRPAPDGGPASVAVVGALGREKGGELIESIAVRARERLLPLRFVVLGDTHRHGGPQSLHDDYLFINGSYRCEELPDLLARYRARLAVFPTIWPETFCLTLSEVLRCGVPVCVPGFGALAERVRALGGGAEIDDWASPDAWLDGIMAELKDEAGAWGRAAAARCAVEREGGETDYPALYRQALGLPAHGNERVH